MNEFEEDFDPYLWRKIVDDPDHAPLVPVTLDDEDRCIRFAGHIAVAGVANAVATRRYIARLRSLDYICAQAIAEESLKRIAREFRSKRNKP
jgi:hypothetical protein